MRRMYDDYRILARDCYRHWAKVNDFTYSILVNDVTPEA